jgi:hypothetical protein
MSLFTWLFGTAIMIIIGGMLAAIVGFIAILVQRRAPTAVLIASWGAGILGVIKLVNSVIQYPRGLSIPEVAIDVAVLWAGAFIVAHVATYIAASRGIAVPFAYGKPECKRSRGVSGWSGG